MRLTSALFEHQSQPSDITDTTYTHLPTAAMALGNNLVSLISISTIFGAC